MDPISKLAESFAEFPGIGTRQAKRFAYFILKRDRAYIDELADRIEHMRKSVRECSKCHRYHVPKHASPICHICSDETRDHSTLLVIEKDPDLESVERSGTYQGLYFILGGTLPILEKEPHKTIRSRELLARIEELANTGLKEVILACSMTPESEHTAEYVRETLLPLQEKLGFTITMLGRGLSTGSELEYSDPETLRYALLGRK